MKTFQPHRLGQRLLQAALGVAGLLAAWVFADLYLRVDLPGAALAAHWAFRVLVGPLEWLTEGEGNRLRWALGIWVAMLVPALALWRRWPGQLVLGASAMVLAGAELLVLALAVLMERAMAGGLLAGLVAAVALGLVRKPTAGATGEHGPSRALVLAPALAAAAIACFYVYSMFMTYGEGYPLIEWAGRLLREDQVIFLPWYLALVVLLGLVAAGVLLRRGGDGRARWWLRLADAAGIGVLVAVLLDRVLDLDGPLFTLLLVLPVGVMLALLLWPVLLRSGPGWSDPRMWPRRLLLPLVLAMLLFGHAYSVRIFTCPDPTIPGLTRLAGPPEVFRVTLARQGALAGLAIRTAGCLGRVTVQPRIGSLMIADPGPVRMPWGPHWRLNGVVEELVYAPSLDRFFATLSPENLEAVKADRDVAGYDAENDTITNLILEVSGDGLRVIEAVAVPGLCWINTLHWNDEERLLYLGCEDRPGIYRFDPEARAFRDGNDEDAIGDVQKLAIDSDGDRLFTVSLWKSAQLSELDRSSLALRRQVTLGGSHYDVRFDPQSGRLFATAFYASRVRAIDADTLEPAGSIPTGLGARALALASDQHLLLASSMYDGMLRICDPTTNEILDALLVGGHVKDIAVDQTRGLAYFWSQCGLFRLDLGQWQESRTKAASRSP